MTLKIKNYFYYFKGFLQEEPINECLGKMLNRSMINQCLTTRTAKHTAALYGQTLVINILK